MPIIPVKVRLNNNDIDIATYAFLDSGSSDTLATEQLISRLGASGRRTAISITTVNCNNAITTYTAVTGLEVCGFLEVVYVPSPTVYTQHTLPPLPVSKEQIPIQDDIAGWPYLSGIVIPPLEADIGVLNRFRQDRFALMADLECMFYSVKIAVEQRDLIHFLWWPDGDVRNQERVALISCSPWTGELDSLWYWFQPGWCREGTQAIFAWMESGSDRIISSAEGNLLELQRSNSISSRRSLGASHQIHTAHHVRIDQGASSQRWWSRYSSHWSQVDPQWTSSDQNLNWPQGFNMFNPEPPASPEGLAITASWNSLCTLPLGYIILPRYAN